MHLRQFSEGRVEASRPKLAKLAPGSPGGGSAFCMRAFDLCLSWFRPVSWWRANGLITKELASNQFRLGGVVAGGVDEPLQEVS